MRFREPISVALVAGLFVACNLDVEPPAGLLDAETAVDSGALGSADAGAADATRPEKADDKDDAGTGTGDGGFGTKVAGNTCGGPGECAAGLTCVDNVCCTSTCNGSCERCGADGVCRMADVGAECRERFRCENFVFGRMATANGIGCFGFEPGEVRGTCRADGQCDANVTDCVAAQLGPAESPEIECNSACEDPATRGCAQGDRLHSITPSHFCLTRQATPSCTGPVCRLVDGMPTFGQSWCDEDGQCGATRNQSCLGFICTAAGDGCRTTCGPGDCAPGFHCDRSACVMD